MAMADSSFEERSVAPTPRRIQQARQSGGVAISRHLAASLSAATACVVFVVAAPSGIAGLLLLMRDTLGEAAHAPAPLAVAKVGLAVAALTVAVPLAALWVVSCVAGAAQTRGLWTSLRLDMSRALPRSSRVVGRDGILEAGKGILFLVFLFAIAFWSIRPMLATIAGLGGTGASHALHAAGVLSGRLAMHVTIAMLTLGTADYLWQRHRYAKALRMNRDEARREEKESEGDPAHKAERLRRQQEAMDPQPIPVVTDALLARNLARVEEGDERPESLSPPVADCLAQDRAPDQGGR